MKRKEFTPAKRKEIRKKLTRWVSVISALLLVAAGAYVGIFSEIPMVRIIEVRGNHLVKREDIVRETKKEFIKQSWWRGALGDKHILFWRDGEMREVAKALPKLKKMEVKRSVWKRKITLIVEEKEAKGVWCAPKGPCFVFNEDGDLFAEAPEVSGYLIVKIMGEEGVPISLGDQVLGNAAWFRNIQKTIEEVEGADIRIRVVRVTTKERNEWVLDAADGREFLFDFTRAPENLGMILRELAKEKEARGGKVFDFRVPDKIYVR